MTARAAARQVCMLSLDGLAFPEAERLGLDMDQAFRLLRKYARARNLRLSDLAQALIDGSETVTGLTVGSSQRLPGAGQVGHQHRPGPGPKP